MDCQVTLNSCALLMRISSFASAALAACPVLSSMPCTAAHQLCCKWNLLGFVHVESSVVLQTDCSGSHVELSAVMYTDRSICRYLDLWELMELASPQL